MECTIGFSPCPNDTFIFDALVNKKIDTGGITFNAVLEDVETLNQWALKGKLEVTKLSFPAFFQSLEHYVLMHAGSALGKGVGPLLVSRRAAEWTRQEIESSNTMLPGAHTTANLLFSFAYPDAKNKVYRLFSEIEDAVLNGEAELGVLIHENRFTYQDKGLHKVADLGSYWETRMNCPIPLGGIAIKRTVDQEKAGKIDQLVRQSLEYAFSNYPLVTEYVKMHSQAMSEEVMRKHIDLYVNNYSIDLGAEGRTAIETLFGVFKNNNPVTTKGENLFL